MLRLLVFSDSVICGPAPWLSGEGLLFPSLRPEFNFWKPPAGKNRFTQVIKVVCTMISVKINIYTLLFVIGRGYFSMGTLK